MLQLYVGAIMVSMLIFFTSLNVHADETLPQKTDSTIWIFANKVSGFIRSLPILTSSELVQEMGKASSNLQTRKLKLAQAAEAKKFKTRDSVIALAMPGGIIYAAAKKLRHKQAVQQFNSVSAQLDELKRNLKEFRLAAYKSDQLASLN